LIHKVSVCKQTKNTIKSGKNKNDFLNEKRMYSISLRMSKAWAVKDFSYDSWQALSLTTLAMCHLEGGDCSSL
jgi:hypothetical protein